MQETTRTRTSTKTHAAAEESSFPCSSQTVNRESDWEFATGGAEGRQDENLAGLKYITVS